MILVIDQQYTNAQRLLATLRADMQEMVVDNRHGSLLLNEAALAFSSEDEALYWLEQPGNAHIEHADGPARPLIILGLRFDVTEDETEIMSNNLVYIGTFRARYPHGTIIMTTDRNDTLREHVARGWGADGLVQHNSSLLRRGRCAGIFAVMVGLMNEADQAGTTRPWIRMRKGGFTVLRDFTQEKVLALANTNPFAAS